MGLKHCVMIEILPRLKQESAAAAAVWPSSWICFVASDGCKQAMLGLETNSIVDNGVSGKSEVK